MKLLTKIEKDSHTYYEVNKITLAGLGALLTAILTFAQTLSPLLVKWFVDVPKDQTETEIKVNEFKLKLLQKSLQNEDQKDRVNSIKLLITTGLLADPNGNLAKIAESPEKIPHWIQQSNLTSDIQSLPKPSPIITPIPLK
jgi:hypothetical protein